MNDFVMELLSFGKEVKVLESEIRNNQKAEVDHKTIEIKGNETTNQIPLQNCTRMS